MSVTIPIEARVIVRERAMARCERCGMPVMPGHVHHRRSRSVHDRHQHCACNLVLLCGTCHSWAHAHPVLATGDGWLVSKFVTEPGTVAVGTHWGIRRHGCYGDYTFQP
jgi:hypothetical protein